MENYQRKPRAQKDYLPKQKTETQKPQELILEPQELLKDETLNMCSHWCHVETFLIKGLKEQGSQNLFHLELLAANLNTILLFSQFPLLK